MWLICGICIVTVPTLTCPVLRQSLREIWEICCCALLVCIDTCCAPRQRPAADLSALYPDTGGSYKKHPSRQVPTNTVPKPRPRKGVPHIAAQAVLQKAHGTRHKQCTGISAHIWGSQLGQGTHISQVHCCSSATTRPEMPLLCPRSSR